MTDSKKIAESILKKIKIDLGRERLQNKKKLVSRLRSILASDNKR